VRMRGNVGRGGVLLGMLAALVIVAALMPIARPAQADGGAPNLIYVVGGGPSDEDLVVIDVQQRAVAWRLPLSGVPYAVALSPDGRYAYVTIASNGMLDVIDAHDKKVVAELPVGKEPTGMALDTTTATQRLLVTDAGESALMVVDATRHTVLDTITVGSHPSSVAIAGPASGIKDPAHAEAWVTSTDGKSVSVVDLVTLKVIATIPMPAPALTVIIPQTSQVAYVGLDDGSIEVVRLASHTALGSLFTLKGSASAQMDYNAVTGSIYVPDPTGNVVQVLRPATGDSGIMPSEPIRTLPFGDEPAAVAIPFDGSFAVIAHRATGQVTMLDLGTQKPIAQVQVFGHPVALITGSYPPALSGVNAAAVGLIITVIVLGGFVVVGQLLIITNRRTKKMQKRQAANDA
jgi:YVTN family beta-propeller protein